jgi:hypothetical protein
VPKGGDCHSHVHWLVAGARVLWTASAAVTVPLRAGAVVHGRLCTDSSIPPLKSEAVLTALKGERHKVLWEGLILMVNFGNVPTAVVPLHVMHIVCGLTSGRERRKGNVDITLTFPAPNLRPPKDQCLRQSYHANAHPQSKWPPWHHSRHLCRLFLREGGASHIGQNMHIPHSLPLPTTRIAVIKAAGIVVILAAHHGVDRFWIVPSGNSCRFVHMVAKLRKSEAKQMLG